jgi:hypothetical protein
MSKKTSDLVMADIKMHRNCLPRPSPLNPITLPLLWNTFNTHVFCISFSLSSSEELGRSTCKHIAIHFVRLILTPPHMSARQKNAPRFR